MRIVESKLMEHETLKTISVEEFDERLEASNGELRQELEEKQLQVRRLEALVVRKEHLARRINQMLTEIESEEFEIASLEKGTQRSRTDVSKRLTASRKSR